MKNRVLVIIVTYNGMKWVDRCFESLKASKEPLDVLVVDNGSGDGTVARIREICREWFLETDRDGAGYWLVDLVEAGENLGFAKANNIGFKYALEGDYQYVYLLNEDAWIFPDTIGKLIAAFESNPEYGVLSPLQYQASLSELDRNFSRKCGKYLPDLSDRDALEKMTDPVPVKFVMAAHWMISRKCLETVGFFSPAFQHYGEDDNFLHRTCYHGFVIGVVPAAAAVHDRGTRPVTAAYRMRMKAVGSMVKLSNPGRPLVWSIFFEPLRLLLIGLSHFSFFLLKDVFVFMGQYPRLIRARRASKKPGAFIEL